MPLPLLQKNNCNSAAIASYILEGTAPKIGFFEGIIVASNFTRVVGKRFLSIGSSKLIHLLGFFKIKKVISFF